MPTVTGIDALKPKGAIMRQARLEQNISIVIDASDYDKAKHGPVVCLHCKCEVSGVRAYTRNDEDKQKITPAFFRLGKLVAHAPSCRFNLSKTINRLVSFSRAVRQFDRDALPIMERVGQGQAAEFRLHILMEAIQKKKSGFGAFYESQSTSSPLESGVGTEFIRTDKVLKPYFRTAKGVLAIAARLQQSAELEAWISLKYANQTVPWDHFFITFNRYRELYRRLSNGHDSSSQNRPVAIVVSILGNQEPTRMSREHRVIGVNKLIKTDEGAVLAIRPVLYFRDEAFAREKVQEEYLLVCGIPRLGKLNLPTKKGHHPRFDISFTVVDPRQLCRYIPT